LVSDGLRVTPVGLAFSFSVVQLALHTVPFGLMGLGHANSS
jgi:hypothetical protein